MHNGHIVAMLVLALFAASCAEDQTTMPEPGGAGGAPGTEPKDEGDDPVPQGLVLELCLSAVKSLETRRDFCNSAWVDPEKKRECWSRLVQSRAEWIGWCYWNF